MRLSSLSPAQLSGAQIALAALLAVVGFTLLLPRPRGRFVPGGVAFLIAAISGFAVWLHTTFGSPKADDIGAVLFGLFSLGALGFGTVLVVQRNPARGAIAFAFVILSTCGLFLLLAAPFLMAATIVIYAGAIIVTFLFVLMLSQVQGQSDENDRSREPLFGGLAGFAFTGLVLFSVYLSAIGNNTAKAKTEPGELPKPEQRLPAPVVTTDERKALAGALAKLDAAAEYLTDDRVPKTERVEYFEGMKDEIAGVVGSVQTSLPGSIRLRLERTPRKAGEAVVPYRQDTQSRAVLERTKSVRELNDATFSMIENHSTQGNPKAHEEKAELRKLREEVLLLYGAGELPARNVANIGYLLYAEHLLAVELAGTLLLVAAIGAIAIAQRKGVAA